MPLVYRIEDKNGRGPYQGYNLNIPGFCTVEHPAPYTEASLKWKFLKNQESWYFGFDSLDQLKRWFYNQQWLETLHEAGLRITVWEVDTSYFRASKTQAVFLRKKAVKVSEQPIIH